MTRTFFVGMLATLAMIASPAVAIEPYDVMQVSSTNVSAQFAAMQAELDSLRDKVDQVSYGGEAKGCDQCGGCDCYCDIGCGGVYAGFELAILTPHFEQGIKNQAFPAPGGQDAPSFDFYATPRIYVGYRNCEGLGVRVRYWTFDQDERLTDPNNNANEFFQALDVTAWDFEATQLVCWGPMQMNFAAGVRYGKVEHSSGEVNINGLDVVESDFEGWGPTLAMEARRPFGCGGLALVGNLRTSLLYGETKALRLDNDALADIDNFSDTLSLGVESQVGIEYSRCMSCGVLKVRALLEGQYWGDVSAIEIDEAGSRQIPQQRRDAIGFVGATLGVEVAR